LGVLNSGVQTQQLVNREKIYLNLHHSVRVDGM